MASAISHAFSAVAVGSVFPRAKVPRRAWVLGAACAVLPDIDVLGFRMGIPYQALWGHRGMTHSLLAAGVVAVVSAVLVSRLSRRVAAPFVLGVYLFLCMALHGLLDAMTNGGLGVAFFAPFSDTRYFLPFRPIQVSPLGIRAFFSSWGLEVMASEALWIGLPGLLLIVVGMALEARRTRHAGG